MSWFHLRTSNVELFAGKWLIHSGPLPVTNDTILIINKLTCSSSNNEPMACRRNRSAPATPTPTMQQLIRRWPIDDRSVHWQLMKWVQYLRCLRCYIQRPVEHFIHSKTAKLCAGRRCFVTKSITWIRSNNKINKEKTTTTNCYQLPNIIRRFNVVHWPWQCNVRRSSTYQ